MNIKELRSKFNLSQQELADQTGIPRTRIAKWEEGKGSPKVDDSKTLVNYFLKLGAKESDSEPLNTVDFKKTLADLSASTPILQVVLNLSYVGKKNADSMDKMAATNQRNTDIIAALVSAILPNSKLGEELTASLVSQHTDDDLPAEAFLGSLKDTLAQTPKQTNDKRSVKNK